MGKLLTRPSGRWSLFILSVSAVLVAAASADAADLPSPLASQGFSAGDWLLRSRIAAFFPVNQSSTVGLVGGRLDTPVMILPDAEIAYFLTDHFSIEGQAGAVRTRPRIVGSLIGDFNIGTIWSVAASASIQYHILPKAHLDPYIGLGFTYSRPISIEPAPGIADFHLNAQTSLMLQAGVDYHLSGNWFANVAVKYVFVPRQVYQGGGARFISDMNMAIVGAGIGYRF